jgi:succinate dehydrogenase/fumarate reductase flavoprotein subunit
MGKINTVFEDCDILVVGGGMGGTGAAYEARYWGRDLKIVVAEKANIDRSGAVAQGLYAINCYMGMQWDENQPEDHVRYARNDLMGLVREDLAYDMARHVDSTVHKFEEWGLPFMKDPDTGRYLREGKWQIMIHGESYKPIVAEAARKSADKIFNRIMITHLLMDESKPNRVGGAVGFNVRTGDFHVFRAKTVIVGAGGASHIFKPRSVGEGMGRTWYAPWSSASAYALPIQVGAKMIHMVTKEAFQDPHMETVGWENFLGMTVGQAVVWASQDIDPKYINPELTTSEPYVMGSHATCSGAWASGPEDISPDEYQWGYNRMMTVDGLFGAGDALGGTAHAFSSGSFTEGRLAAKAAVKYIRDMRNEQIKVSEKQFQDLKTVVYKPMENYAVGHNEITGGTVSTSYLLPIQGLQRLEKIMDEYAGGISVNYMTNEPLLLRGLDLLSTLHEDLDHLGAEDLHQLQRAWELKHRAIASECVVQHTLFRKETRWPGYYYRGDHMKLDDENWHALTLSRRDPESGEWEMEKAPVYHLVD